MVVWLDYTTSRYISIYFPGISTPIYRILVFDIALLNFSKFFCCKIIDCPKLFFFSLMLRFNINAGGLLKK